MKSSRCQEHAKIITMKPSCSSCTRTIVVVGLNAALQKRFVLDHGVPLIPGQVHRASRITTGIGGKGQDVAVALSCLQHMMDHDDDTDDDSKSPTTYLLQFIGIGPAGDEIVDLLERRFDVSLATTVRTAAPLRTCTSIVGLDVTTELIEPSSSITDDEFATLLATIPVTHDDDTDTTPLSSPRRMMMIAAVCFMGSLPPGCPDDAYAQIYQRICASNKCNMVEVEVEQQSSSAIPPPLCVIDSVSGLEALLAVTIPDRTMLKLNVAEFCQLVDIPRVAPTELVTAESSSSERDTTKSVVIRAIQEFRRRRRHQQPQQRGGATYVALTDGPRAAYLDDGDTLRRLPVPTALLPPITTTTTDGNNHNHKTLLFPIGAGDAVAAGLIWAWTRSTRSSGDNNSDNNNHNPTLLLNNNKTTAVVENAFSFGLAVGTASCFHEENSVFDPVVALDLYRRQRTAAAAASMVVLYRHHPS
jgi:fructose-1-phosphate kinase PfkB-like protein